VQTGGALEDLIFEGRRDGEAGSVLSTRGDAGDCSGKDEGELQLHRAVRVAVSKEVTTARIQQTIGKLGSRPAFDLLITFSIGKNC
jgi:hypothetical protein